MRLFYATYLSHDNMRAYQGFVDGLIEEVPGTLRSVPHQTHHLTLGFLGEIAESQVELCSTTLDEVAGFDTFEYQLGQPSILMGRGGPRLIRVEVTQNAQRISQIQAALLFALSEHLTSIDTRSKPPHITLARFKRNVRRGQAAQVQDALDRLSSTPIPTMDRFTGVQLVRSSLTPSGPNYETVREIRL